MKPQRLKQKAVGSDDESVTAPPEAEPEMSPAARLAQLTAELDALHHTQLLVSPHVDKNR